MAQVLTFCFLSLPKKFMLLFSYFFFVNLIILLLIYLLHLKENIFLIDRMIVLFPGKILILSEVIATSLLHLQWLKIKASTISTCYSSEEINMSSLRVLH